MKKYICLSLIIFILASMIDFSLANEDNNDRNVLIIHSYYQHFAWTYGLQKGIEDNLEKDNINYYLEYLDEHRLTDKRSNEDIYIMIKEKYKDIHFESIIVADNFAYNFVRDYYDDLFPDADLVLVGINNMKEDMIFKDNITGVAQTISHKKMIALVKELHPNMSNLIIAGSNNQTSINERKSYKTAIKGDLIEEKTEFINVEYLEDLYAQLEVYDDRSVVIVTSLILDKNRTMNLGPMYISNIIDNSGLAVYVAVDVMMGYEGEGAVGGYIVDSGVHGAIAADMVNQIMDGRSASDIPIKWEPVVTPKFNYYRLEQFNIDRNKLPKDSVILGEPINGMVISYISVFIYVVVLGILILMMLLLIYQIKRRKVIEHKLLIQSRELEINNKSLLKQNEKIDFLLKNDSITNFKNRNYFIELVDELLMKNKNPIMYAIYINNIKQLDNTFGYQLGDSARYQISNFIRAVFKYEDVIFARYYDTFYIVESNYIDCEDINMKIGKLEIALQKNIKIKEYDFESKIKIGVVEGSNGDSGADLLKKADITIINAMLNENEVYTNYDKSFHCMLEEKVNMEKEIKRAIRDKSFELYYQPQIDCISEKVVSCEALIRWKTANGNYVSPSLFIPLAEEMGLIQEIGDWVIFESCKQLEKWEKDNVICSISINVSAKQINNHLLDTFKGALSLFDVDSSDIYLEITETAVMDDAKNNIRILQEVSELGIRVALDDFGIGYSSLKYIMDFPISKLKIDKSFIDDIENSEQHAIVKAMYELGKVFNYEVIAEGVESKLQKEIVKSIGIDLIQGYYYSKALSEEDFKEYYYKNCPEEFSFT